MYAAGFDARIVTPTECVELLKEDFRRDFRTDDVATISKRIRETHRVLLGSNDCQAAFIHDPRTEEVLFRTHWIDGQLHLEANVYDDVGELVARLQPLHNPEVLLDGAALSLQNAGPKIFYSIVPSAPEPKIEQYLRVGNDPASQFVLNRNSEILLSGRIVPTGHVLFEGSFFNAKGELIARIEKKSFVYLNMSFLNSSGVILPPQVRQPTLGPKEPLDDSSERRSSAVARKGPEIR